MKQADNTALSLRGLSKHFRSTAALDDVSLQVEPGEFIALLGPSGSGKTTLLRLLAGFDLPTSGTVMIGGRDVSALPPGERDIGMVFQHYALFPHLTVRRNVEYGLRMHGWSRTKRKERAEELLGMVKLGALADRSPQQLSGGQQQRVAIARALAYEPKILLMDEPLGALDRTLRVEMAEEIRRIHRSFGTTFVYVTHDRDEAMILADRIVIMHNGRIVANDEPEALFVRPNNEFVAHFFAGMNVVPPEHLGLSGSGPIGFSPAAVTFSQPDEPHVVLECRMVDRLFFGERIQVVLDTGDTQFVAHVPTLAGFDVEPGTTLAAYISRVRLVSLSSH
ncbi:ABC transporter ATP-binding protein [Pararhizobium mangrovi]|nr:ABC transporter ATP-binding protein [Pararhizobium mangrovi]